MKKLIDRFLHLIPTEPESLSYAEARNLLRSRQVLDRRRVAADVDGRPEMLYYLATDQDPSVRLSVAGNRSAPAQANLMLATDASDSVREALAGKVSGIAGGLGPQDTDRQIQINFRVLETLVRDQAVQVRRILAETLKELPDAPLEIVRRLARDPEFEVAAPVLQYSRVLVDQDLLAVLRDLPCVNAPVAVAKRADLSPDLAEYIARSDHAEAITALLENPSAQIREQTLDYIVSRAAGHTPWHRPLVSHPLLSETSALSLARFVARDLIAQLRERSGLRKETVAELERIVFARIEQEGTGSAVKAVPPAPVSAAAPAETGLSSDHPLYRQLHRLIAARALDEAALAAALAERRSDFVKIALELLAEMPFSAVQRMLDTQSGKGIMALAWKAGLSAEFGARVQSDLAGLPPALVLRPAAGNKFPLSEEAMLFQLAFFRDEAAAKAAGSGH